MPGILSSLQVDEMLPVFLLNRSPELEQSQTYKSYPTTSGFLLRRFELDNEDVVLKSAYRRHLYVAIRNDWSSAHTGLPFLRPVSS